VVVRGPDPAGHLAEGFKGGHISISRGVRLGTCFKRETGKKKRLFVFLFFVFYSSLAVGSERSCVRSRQRQLFFFLHPRDPAFHRTDTHIQVLSLTLALSINNKQPSFSSSLGISSLFCRATQCM
jgi:hypothetical protein